MKFILNLLITVSSTTQLNSMNKCYEEISFADEKETRSKKEE